MTTRGWGALVGVTMALVASASGCSTPPPPASAHNLERPSDIAFACVGLFGAPSDDAGAGDGLTKPQVSGRPMAECHVPHQFDLPPTFRRRTFGFVANTARHELSLVDMDNSKLIDLDPTNPGTNVAPLGVLPEQIAASDDGCRIVSANRGSCDLTLVDVGALVTPTLAAEASVTTLQAPRTTVSQDIVVQGPAGKRLYVSPQEVQFLPQDTSAVTGPQNLCERARPHADPVGWNQTPATPKQDQWKALVTYPSCDLVALVNLPSGIIVDSVKITPGADGQSVTVVNTGADPDCPVHDFCDDSQATSPDAGATDAADGGRPAPVAVNGATFVNPTGTRPGPLAITPDGQRAYVGLTQASFITPLMIQEDKLVIPPVASIPLHEGALGAERIRLSVDPYKRTGEPGQFGRFVGEGPDRTRQYLYVIAHDGTVRVVDVSPAGQGLPEQECDTNVDPAQVMPPLMPDDERATTCFAVNDANTARRRPLSRGPGIRLPTIPRDVAFIDVTLGNHRESVLDGAYAFVLTASGAVYLVNIAPTLRTETLVGAKSASDPPLPSPLLEEPPLVNSLRDHNALTYTTLLDPTLGPPRVDLAPVAPVQGPQIEGITTTVADDNATDTTGMPVPTYVFFPKSMRSAVNRQTWATIWQGDFFGPSFSGQFSRDPADQPLAQLKDVGVDFCQAGALPGDVVTIYGCVNNQQCGPLQVCGRSQTAAETVGTLPINGLCVPLDPTQQAQQLKTCAELLDTVRRYEIVNATTGAGPSTPGFLTIRPKLDEIVTKELNGCGVVPSAADGGADVDGGADASGGTGDGGTPRPCGEPSDPTRAKFQCVEIDTGKGERCVQRCATAIDCRAGRTCVDFGGDNRKFCADAPDLTAALIEACQLNQLTAYKLGVGNGFLVQGTAATPFIPPRVDKNGTCEANPERLNRLPYFQTAADGTRTQLPLCDGDLSSVDSSLTGMDLQVRLHTIVTSTAPINAPCLIPTATATSGDTTLGPPFRALFQNRELRFILANLESYFSDSVQITFDVHGGFLADTVFVPGTIDVEMPTRIVTSPIDSQSQLFDQSATTEIPYLFVVDQRRLGRVSAGVGATRGQVLRINPRRAYTTDVNSLLPIYEDPSLSVNLWPIQ